MAEFSRRSEQIAEHSRAPPSRVQSRPWAKRHRRRGHASARQWRRSPPGRTRPSTASPSSPTTGANGPRVTSPEDEQTRLGLEPRRTATTCRCLHADDLGEAILADAAQAVVTTVAEHHSTYGRQNLLAEAHRMLHGVRFASPDDRVAVAEHITELAIARSVMLTPPPLHHTPGALRPPRRVLAASSREPHRLHHRGPPRRRSAPPRSRESSSEHPG